MLGGGIIERVKGVIVWLAWLVFAGSNKSVTKIKQHRKTFFVKITCQYSDVCFFWDLLSLVYKHICRIVVATRFEYFDPPLPAYVASTTTQWPSEGANVRRRPWVFFRRRSQLADLRGHP